MYHLDERFCVRSTPNPTTEILVSMQCNYFQKSAIESFYFNTKKNLRLSRKIFITLMIIKKMAPKGFPNVFSIYFKICEKCSYALDSYCCSIDWRFLLIIW